jgi:glycosyltransferase involved in cell wall biosynthesis
VLRALDAFVLPSHWEGEPIALLEAMAVGLPCVATATHGAREILDGSGAGVLVAVGSPAALAAALETLEAGPFHRLQMGRRAREIATDRGVDATAAAVLQVYSDVA